MQNVGHVFNTAISQKQLLTELLLFVSKYFLLEVHTHTTYMSLVILCQLLFLQIPSLCKTQLMTRGVNPPQRMLPLIRRRAKLFASNYFSERDAAVRKKTTLSKSRYVISPLRRHGTSRSTGHPTRFSRFSDTFLTFYSA